MARSTSSLRSSSTRTSVADVSGRPATGWHSRWPSAKCTSGGPARRHARRARLPDREAGAVDRYAGRRAGGRPAAAPRRSPGSRPSPTWSSRTPRPASAARWCAARRRPAACTVTLEDRHGRHRVFPLGPGFLVDGRPVALVRAAPAARGGAAPAYGLGLGRRARRAGPGRPRRPDLRRGPARRRAGREGVGRRPARRGRRRRAPRRHRRPAGRRARLRARAGPPARRARRPPGARQQGVPAGRAGRCSPHVRVVGHPYVDVWQAVRPAAPRHRGLAGGPARHAVEGGRLRRRSAGRSTRPPPGAASSARSRRTPTWSPSLLGRVEELIDFVTARRVAADRP